MLKRLPGPARAQIVGEGIVDVWCAPLPGSYCMRRERAETTNFKEYEEEGYVKKQAPFHFGTFTYSVVTE